MIDKNRVLFCNRCYHHWGKRKKGTPKYCPKCKSPYWNKKRKRKVNIKGIVQKTKKQILIFHDNIIILTGGLQGTRDDGGLENATLKIITKIDKNHKRQTKLGAFILHDFATRHYFNDGNKRIAYFTSKVFMLIRGWHLQTEYSEAKDFILEVAKDNSKITIEEIKNWLDERCIRIKPEEIEKYLKDFLVSMLVRKEEWEN